MSRFEGQLEPADAEHDPSDWEPDDDDQPRARTAFRSRFGGLWTDLENAPSLLAGKQELGRIDDDDARRLGEWIEEGFVILEGAVSEDEVEAVRAEMSATLAGEEPARKAEWWSDGEKQFGDATAAVMERPGAKLLDLHYTGPRTQELIFAPPITHFLKLIFERPPLAFQSLAFLRGTQQPPHQDSAFVRVESALEFAAVWVALEDVEPGSGELEYFPGSHALPEALFDGRYKWVPEGTTVVEGYSERLVERAQAAGLTRSRFLARKGDALVWSADLIHGGSAELRPGSSRRSIVTHYCPFDRSPAYARGGGAKPTLETVGGGYVCEQRRR